MEDVKEECQKYGPVVSLLVPKENPGRGQVGSDSRTTQGQFWFCVVLGCGEGRPEMSLLETKFSFWMFSFHLLPRVL